LTVKLKVAVAACGGLAESVTCTVKENVPIAEGVPLKTPALLKVSPDGRGPEFGARAKVNGAVPPVAGRVWLYGTPKEAFASVPPVSFSWAAIRMVSV
jgi:hypothetical protein